MTSCFIIHLPLSVITTNIPLSLHQYTLLWSLCNNPPSESLFQALTHTRCPVADRCGARQHKAMLGWPIERFVRPHWEATQITDHWINEHMRLPLGRTPTHAVSQGTQIRGIESWPQGSLLFISFIGALFNFISVNGTANIKLIWGKVEDITIQEKSTH